jgi:DNA-binding transcriptional regulator LsrR (DeoR family)
MVLNEVRETPINAVQVSENLNIRRNDAQRWLNKARNESNVSIYPEEHMEKLSSIFDRNKRELNNNKYYIRK